MTADEIQTILEDMLATKDAVMELSMEELEEEDQDFARCNQ